MDRVAQAESRAVSAESTRPGSPSPLTFWILVTTAAALLAPCMLLPEWRAYQGLRLAEETTAAQLTWQRERVDHLQRTADRLANDPTAVARLAKRQLAYTTPGETIVLVSAPVPIVLPRHVPTPPALPRSTAVLTASLPLLTDDSLFATEPTRSLLIALATALMLAAFWLYPPRRAHAASRREPPVRDAPGP